jgi:glycosyltransferase involved in cell wall biosynthesis
MFTDKETEADLKLVIEGALAVPFEVYENQGFDAHYTALKNVLLYVRNMTVETIDDAAFRVKAVDFADKLLLLLANSPVLLNTTAAYKEVYTLSPMVPFSNQDLLKEKNLNGYFLSKLTGGDHHLAFGDVEKEYPYEKYVGDIDFPCLAPKDFTLETYKEYIIQNICKMDILILPFLSNATAYFEKVYLENRKDGKVIITAYTNRQHIDAHFQMSPELVQPFFESADVATVAANDLRDKMNGDKENKFPVFTLRHSFANATGEDLSVTASEKENVIISVGRLGLGSKNIYALIEAFSRAADLMPDWKLLLVGEPPVDMRRIINVKYAHIRNRIKLTGELDKAALYKCYAGAKIHCMSTLADVSPLVCAEAMAFGCYQVLPDSMDGAEDITRNGEYGVVYEQEKYITHPEIFKYEYIEGYDGEAEQNLANALVEAAHKLDYGFFKDFIPKSKKLQRTEFDFAVNGRILGLLLFS